MPVHYRATTEGVRWLPGAPDRTDRRGLPPLAIVRATARRSRPNPTWRWTIIERYEACLQEAGDAPLPAVADRLARTRAGLASRLAAEDGRLSLEARLPWVEYARRQFKALAGRLARR